MSSGIRKIIVVPSRWITQESHRGIERAMSFLSHAVRLRIRTAFQAFTANMLCTEVQHYGDLPKILGRENTYIVGRYYPEYVRTDVPPMTRYPSLHKTPDGTVVTLREALSLVKSVDAVVIGLRSGSAGEAVRREALKRGVRVAIMDYFDHLEIYDNPDPRLLTRGFEKGSDFHVFFKHDYPSRLQMDSVFPLAPMPVRVESFPENFPPMESRKISVFYRGQKRADVLRSDRSMVAEEIQKLIPDAVIDNQEQRKTQGLSEYWGKLSQAKIALTPAGKVWDSTRHCETAMFGCVPLIPEPDCLTVNNLVRNGENAITYQASKIKGQSYEIASLPGMLERVQHYLRNPGELSRLARAWRDEVLSHHSTEARARYLLSCLGAAHS